MNTSTSVFELRKQHSDVLDKAEAILSAADSAGRDLTGAENAKIEALTSEAEAVRGRIQAAERTSTIRRVMRNGKIIPGGGPRPGAAQAPMSEGYTEAFLSFLRSGGKQTSSELSEGFDPLFGGFALPALPGMSSALYEGTGGGSDGAGGYAISVPTDSQIVPLAVPDLGVRPIARVIATATDIKIPSQATFGTAGVKAESGASANTFSESDPTLGQLTLSAFMLGLTHTVSWELLQDVALFQEFGVRDLLNAVAICEDNFFVNGSGSAQPQGLVGNTGTGTASPYLVESTGVYLLNAIDDILGTLKGSYFPNAAWLMSRATGVAIRKAQRQVNLFDKVWTREGGRDLLHGYPVSYSSNMPALPTATTAGVTPILFGSFTDGYVIGDRGGSGTFVKILDQPLATQGQTILLGYKRVDGRVRRSEAIQAISISHT
jgi:HK97 family phage major capsid protein